jgi:ribosome maturation factor RimP
VSLVDQLTAAVAPVVASLGVELVDVEHAGGTVRVLVDEPGGIGLDRIAAVTQAVSRALDERDPLPGRYTLEVSSPGVERPLRTPRHFGAAVGQKVALRVVDDQGARRVSGVLLAADDDGVTIAPDDDSPAVIDQAPDGTPSGQARFGYGHIERARTVFEWGPAPKPGKGSKPGAAKKGAAAKANGTSPSRSDGRAGGRRQQTSGGATNLPTTTAGQP